MFIGIYPLSLILHGLRTESDCAKSSAGFFRDFGSPVWLDVSAEYVRVTSALYTSLTKCHVGEVQIGGGKLATANFSEGGALAAHRLTQSQLSWLTFSERQF